MKCDVLSAVADWYEDTKNHTFVLKGFIHISPELKQVRDSLLDYEPESETFWEAIERLQRINRQVISSDRNHNVSSRRLQLETLEGRFCMPC